MDKQTDGWMNGMALGLDLDGYFPKGCLNKNVTLALVGFFPKGTPKCYTFLEIGSKVASDYAN